MIYGNGLFALMYISSLPAGRFVSLKNLEVLVGLITVFGIPYSLLL
jgi:hypothetical protein